MNRTHNIFQLLVVVMFLMVSSIEGTSQEYQLVRYEPLIQITKKLDPNSSLRKIDDYNAQYTTTSDGVLYSFGFSWAPPDPQTVYSGDIVGIQMNPTVINMGNYMVGCSMTTYVEGITNGNRRINAGSAGAGRSGQTGKIYEKSDKALYRLHEADENDIVITLIGGATNDEILFGKFHFRKVGGPIIGGKIVLNTPSYTPNVWWGNQYWMGINLPGHIRLAQGQQLILVARFYNHDNNPLIANNQQFSDANGNVASAFQIDAIPSNEYQTDNVTLYIPYSALGLGQQGSQNNYSLKFYVEVFLDGTSSGVSEWVNFGVVW